MTARSVTEQTDLKERWNELREQEPSLRIRDAATRLGVSEAELLATGCGTNVTRLRPEFAEILQDFHALGRIMALTRNEEIVHERKGEYKNVEIMTGHGQMGLAVNDDIDLRIFFSNWHFAFAVTTESPRGTLKSFQFFDRDGTAVHKVFLTDDSDAAEYDRIVEKYRSDDQTALLAVQSKPATPPEKADSEIDVEGFRKSWAELKDTHDFFPLLRRFGVSRLQALRLADKEMAREVDRNAYQFILNEASKSKLPIMVFVANNGIIQIHTGEVERVLEAKGWFNVMDERFNLHIDQGKIATTFVVVKPTDDGAVTSVELFNSKGENVALFFGKRKPGIPESKDWRALVSRIESLKRTTKV